MSEQTNTTVDFEDMARQWSDAVMDSWAGMTRAMVGSDAFAAASSAYLDWTLHAQKQLRSQSGQFMDAMEFPKRSDLARLSKQVLAAEGRIAECEDKLDELNDKLDRVLNILGSLKKQEYRRKAQQ